MIKYKVDYDHNAYLYGAESNDRSWIVWKITFDGKFEQYAWIASFITREMARKFKGLLDEDEALRLWEEQLRSRN